MSGPIPQRRMRRDRGAVLPLFAIALPVLLLMTAFAVDLGRQRSARRTMQARADVIALDMVRLADGRTEDQITTSSGYVGYLADSAEANHADHIFSRGDLIVEYGTWSEASGFVQTLGSATPTAVKVTAIDEVDYYFQPGSGRANRSAIARTDALAGFSIGSLAAAVNSGGGPLLDQLIGDALGAGVLSYSGLATADLTYAGIAAELGLASAEELFNGSVSAFEFVDAAAAILERNGATTAQIQALDAVLSVPALEGVSVGDVIHVEPGGEEGALSSGFNVLDFIAGAAFIANGQSGLTIPSTMVNLPGLTQSLQLHLTQAPQTVFGRVGASTGTSQAGLSTQFTLGTGSTCQSALSLLGLLGGLVDNLLSLLTGAGTCQLVNRVISVEIQANLSFNLASAQGTIARIGCGSTQQLDVDVRSDLVTATINMNAVVKAGNTTLTTFPLLASAGGGDWNGAADFILPPDEFDTFYPVNPGSGSIGLSPASFQIPTALAPLLTPVLNGLLNGNPNANPPVIGIVPLVESRLLAPLSSILGLRVASADVAPRAVSCHSAQLVG